MASLQEGTWYKISDWEEPLRDSALGGFRSQSRKSIPARGHLVRSVRLRREGRWSGTASGSLRRMGKHRVRGPEPRAESQQGKEGLRMGVESAQRGVLEPWRRDGRFITHKGTDQIANISRI